VGSAKALAPFKDKAYKLGLALGGMQDATIFTARW
jgi:hypothetical protein